MQPMPCYICHNLCPMDESYSEDVVRVYCRACMARLALLHPADAKCIMPGKCSIPNCHGNSYFLMIKLMDLNDLVTIEVPMQFCASHHGLLVNGTLSSEKEESFQIPEFNRKVDL